MNTQELQQALAVGGITGFFLGFMTVIIIMTFIWWILNVIATWLQFKKAGEAGWKSIIPIYSDYVEFKLYWKTNYFWIGIIIVFIFALFAGIFQKSNPNLSKGLQTVASIAALFFNLFLNWFKCKAFNKSNLFSVLHLIPGIAIITNFILGFGSDQYIGNQSTF